MNITDTQTFLNIIDSRIKKYINESKLLRQYIGTVVELTDTNAKCRVKLAGNDTVFTFLNKSGEILQVNDNVYIQTTGTDLNTGIITQKTKEDNNIIDYIIEQNINFSLNQWSVRKWNSGIIEAWGDFRFRLMDMRYIGNDNYSDTLVMPFDTRNPRLFLTPMNEKHTTVSLATSGDYRRQDIIIDACGNYPELYDTTKIFLHCHIYDTWK